MFVQSMHLKIPDYVNKFYNERRTLLTNPTVQPNKAHRNLATLESYWKGDFLLVTQNIDNLHERAGQKKYFICMVH